MKIIDNKKDYYDYLSGINGIDEYVVYDRRGSVPVYRELDGYFKPLSTELGDPIKRYYVVIVAGDEKFGFVIDREAVDGKINIVCRTKEQYAEDENIKPRVMRWLKYDAFDFITPQKDLSPKSPLLLYYRTFDGPWEVRMSVSCIKNPILSKSPFFVPAEKIWNAIYNYLLKSKEPIIEDNRTDTEHLEAHGFDKKTSFRKM